MSAIDLNDDTVEAELDEIARAVSKLEAFRAAALEITQHIQLATSQNLCRDLTEIRVTRALIFNIAVSEKVREKAISYAQEAVSKIVKSTTEGILKHPEAIAEFGLVDSEHDPIYSPGKSEILLNNMTDEFADAIARSGMMTYLNEGLNEMILAVVHEDDEEELPISYKGLSTNEERALYKAFIHAAHQAMQKCNYAAEDSDAKIFNYLEKLEARAP